MLIQDGCQEQMEAKANGGVFCDDLVIFDGTEPARPAHSVMKQLEEYDTSSKTHAL
jgi:hypothetical protein